MANRGPPCLCRGRFYNGEFAGHHYVWMAFLNYENKEYRQEEWGRDYQIFPMNRITCWLSASTIFHCQMFFWDESMQTFRTISVDADHEHVFESTQKEFQYGWTFVELEVTQEEELAMYRFLEEQKRQQRPFNWAGAISLFGRPITTDGLSWFCSQLDAATLQCAGYLLGVQPHATSPADLYRLMKRQLACKEIPTPVCYKRVRNALSLNTNSRIS